MGVHDDIMQLKNFFGKELKNRHEQCPSKTCKNASPSPAHTHTSTYQLHSAYTTAAVSANTADWVQDKGRGEEGEKKQIDYQYDAKTVQKNFWTFFFTFLCQSGNPDSILHAGGGPDSVKRAGGSPDSILRAGGGPDGVVRAGDGPDAVVRAGDGPDGVVRAGDGPDVRLDYLGTRIPREIPPLYGTHWWLFPRPRTINAGGGSHALV